MTKYSTTDEFFNEQTQKSQIKSSIVSNFFSIYLPIILRRFNRNDIYYIDLFSGPGSYDDGTKSTPLHILDQIENLGQNNPQIFDKIHFFFNEKDKGNYGQLIDKVKTHPIYSKLKHCPSITNQDANDVDLSQIENNSPIFSFVDPFGYISTSAKQIWELVRNIGSDCIFFFNANRIILDINKKDRDQYFLRLFGEGLYDLRNDLQVENSHRLKMEKVLQCFSDNLFKSYKNPRFKLFILPFGFEFDDRTRLSRYLLFITKNHKAVLEMKNVMNKLATSITETYCYDSKAVNQISLFDEASEISNTIFSTIRQFETEIKNPPSGMWKAQELLEYLDVLKMSRDKRVTPFSLRNFKIALREAYDQGFINETLTFKKNEIFADTKEFTFKKDFWGDYSMSGKTTIEWTECSWNPITGCTKLSEGCKNCYAARLAKRLKAMGNVRYENGFDVTVHNDLIALPLKWKKSRMVFVNSMSDLFHEDVSDNDILRIFKTMNDAPQHQFQILTKRSQRLLELSPRINWTNNIWMGVSIENQDVAFRLDHLKQTGAYIKFISAEPLISSLTGIDLNGVDWLIVGGESGPGCRPIEKEWVKELRELAQTTNTAFFFKQWGGNNKKKNGSELEGKRYKEYPAKYVMYKPYKDKFAVKKISRYRLCLCP